MRKKEKIIFDDVKIFDSVGFDLSEAVSDLIYNIKELRKDVNNIKKYLKLY